MILFSVSYGPDPEGKVSMNFGPLNRDGGWRRLNVAVTRSRCEMKVFSSLEPEQIKISEATPEGVKAFRRFLMYAEGNDLWCEDLKATAASSETAHKTSTGIIDSMCSRLNEEGFETEKSVGKSGFKVDIGVKKAGSDSYCLGILIWSIDWWEDSDSVMKAILDKINKVEAPKEEEPAPAEAVTEAPAQPSEDAKKNE